MTINVVDAGCGVGKTTALINKMNNDTSEQRYLYVTPFLDEVERIKEQCPNKHFASPENKATKLQGMITLLHKKRNIVTTHSLFRRISDRTVDLSLLNDYILVMDEVVDTIEEIHITKSDLKILGQQYLTLDENNRVHWNEPDYEGKFDNYKDAISSGNIYAYSNSNKEIVTLNWLLPSNVFNSFKQIFVLTYMFNCQIQKKYFDYFGFDYKQWYVKNFALTDEKQVYDYSEQKNLINVCKKEKLNEIGRPYYSLSIAWFTKNKNTPDIKRLQKNMRNFAVSCVEASSSEVLWTTFQEYRPLVQGKGYNKGFAPINSRATNKYKSKRVVIYLGNRFLKPTLKNFFKFNNIEIDTYFEEQFALSELIQFLYRSQIRDGKPIEVYIPSKRMRALLLEWIKKPND